jgi:hypothetical protein
VSSSKGSVGLAIAAIIWSVLLLFMGPYVIADYMCYHSTLARTSDVAIAEHVTSMVRFTSRTIMGLAVLPLTVLTLYSILSRSK